MSIFLAVLFCCAIEDISEHEKECRDAYERVISAGDFTERDIELAREYFRDYLPYQSADKK